MSDQNASNLSDDSNFEEWLNEESLVEENVSKEASAIEKTLICIKDRVLNRNISTIKEKKTIMNLFTSAINTSASPALYKKVKKEVVMETWKVLINFFNNLNKKNISDLIKIKSQYITENGLDEYLVNKDSIIDKSITVRMTELLDFLNALAKLLDVAKHNFIDGEGFKDLISWIIEQVIGEDFTVFGDYVENFYDLNGKYSELYRYHYQNMLNVVLINPQALDRNLYDKLLESQYLIFTEENTSRFSSCYNLSIKILSNVMKHRLLGKVHGTWEKLLVNAFRKFLMDTYTVKKVNEDFIVITQYMLEWSFVFDNENYGITSRVLIDNFIKAKKFDDTVFNFLKNYLDFLPYDVEYQVTFNKNNFFLDDMLRLLKFLLLNVIEVHNKDTDLIPETYTFKEFPKEGSDLRIYEYEYVNSTDGLNIIAEYIGIYFYLKEKIKLFDDTSEKDIFVEDKSNIVEPLENSRVKKDVMNYVMPLLRHSISLCEFIGSLKKACEESINFEKIVPVITAVLLKYQLNCPIDYNFVRHVNTNRNLGLHHKYMLNSSLLFNVMQCKSDNCISAVKKDIAEALFLPYIEALSRLNENIPSMSYFVGLFTGWINREKTALNHEQLVKVRIKVIDILKNIRTQSPIGDSLEIFKVWKNFCLLIPYVDNNILQNDLAERESLIFEGFDFTTKNDSWLDKNTESQNKDLNSLKNYEISNGLTTFELILKDWLPIALICEDALSFSNFFYWGYSQDTDTYIQDAFYAQQKTMDLCYSYSNSYKQRCNVCKEETTDNFRNGLVNNNKGSTTLPFIKSKILFKNNDNMFLQNFLINISLKRKSKLMSVNRKVYLAENSCSNKSCPQYTASYNSDVYEGRGMFRSYKSLFYLIKYAEKMYVDNTNNNGLGWMRLLIYLSEDTEKMSGKIHSQLLSLIDRLVLPKKKYTADYMATIISNYDIYSIEYLNPKYFSIFECLGMGSEKAAFYNVMDNENDLMYFSQLFQDISLQPFHQLTDRFTWVSFKKIFLESSTFWKSANQFDLFLETFFNKVSSLNSQEKSAIVNVLITNIKDDINSEKCHDIHMLKMFLLIVGKILASSILMEGQSKNKTLKLWISIHDMSYSGIYQSGTIESLESLFKRLDYKSQNSVLVNIQQSLIEKQDVQIQFEMLTSLSKISKSLMVFCFKKVLTLLNKKTYILFELMLSELCKWYNFKSKRKLFAALNYDIMVVLMSDLLETDLTIVPDHVILSLNAFFDEPTLLNVYEICEKLLKDENLAHIFVCSCLILTTNIDKLKALGILEFQSNDVIKADVLYSSFKKESSICVVDQLRLTKVETLIPKECYYHTKFKEQLKLLDTSSLANIASGILAVCPHFDRSVLQDALYENKPISFLKLSSLSVPELLLADPVLNKNINFYSSLMIELPILKTLTELGGCFSVYEVGISAMRKLKIVYLLILGLCQDQSVLDRVTLNFLEYIIKIDNFESLFDSFKSFLFILMSKVKSKKLSFEIKIKIMSKLYSVKNKLDLDHKKAIHQFVEGKGLPYPLFYQMYQFIFDDPEDIDVTMQHTSLKPVFLKVTSAANCLEDLNVFMTDLILKTRMSIDTAAFLMLDFSQETFSMVNWENISSLFAARLLEDFKMKKTAEVTKMEKNHLSLISESLLELKASTKNINDLLELTLLSLSFHLSEEYQDADEDLEEDFFCSLSKLNLEFNFEEAVTMTDFTDIIDYETETSNINFGGIDGVDNDSYLDWLHNLWKHLTLHFSENSIFNFIWVVDRKFNSNHLKHKFLYSVIVSLSTVMDKSVISEWGKFFNFALTSNFNNIHEFRLKASALLKIFILIRSLGYDEDKVIQQSFKSKYKHLYDIFVLEDMVDLCLALNDHELAFMLAEEDIKLWKKTSIWKNIFKGLNSEYDIFLKTSIPMELELTEYLNNSKEYSKDIRFSQSVLGFNLASLETNYQQNICLKNIQYSLENQGEHYLAKSLISQEKEDYINFNQKFESYYTELQNWDIPLSDSCNEEAYLFNYSKSKLLFDKEYNHEVDTYGYGLIKNLMLNNKKNIEEKVLGLNDIRLNILSDISLEKTNMLSNSFKASCVPTSEFFKKRNKSDLFSTISSGLVAFKDILSYLDNQDQYKVLKYYNENLKILVYSNVFADNLKSAFKVDQNSPGYDEMQIPSKQMLKELGLLHLLNLSYMMERAENEYFESFNWPIKELIRCQKFIELLNTYYFDEHKEWEDHVNLMNLICRWHSGDKISSFYHLNNMLERDDNVGNYDFKNILKINKIKWTLESKSETLKTTWTAYHQLVNDIKTTHKYEDNLFSYHSKDIYTINAYYFGILNAKMDNYNPDYKEMDTLLRKHAEIREQQISCKKYLTLFQNNADKKKKMSETLKVISTNEKFVAERYNEIQRSMKNNKNEIINMTVCLISILSDQICTLGNYAYKETENTDMFFSLWFDLINFFSKDYFDIDKLGNKEVEKLQIENIKVNFKQILEFQTIADMPMNKENKEANWIKNRCTIIGWKDILKKWVDSIENILSSNRAACLPWLGTIFAKISTGHIEVNENCNIFSVLLECYLNKIIISCIEEYPDYSIHLANSYMNYSSDNNDKARLRSSLISQLMTSLVVKNSKLMKMADDYKSFSNIIKDLSLTPTLKKVARISLTEKQNCKVIFKKTPDEIFEVFSEKRNIINPLVDYVKLVKSNSDLKQYHIVNIGDMINMSTSGLSRPRIFNFQLKNGTQFKVLAKGNDDLKSDEIMLKVMRKIDNLIFKEKEGTDLKYRLLTYQVFPMGHNFGMMEFIKDVSSLNDILKPMHKDDEISQEELRKKMDASYKAKDTSQARVKVFTDMCELVTPRFNQFFRINFLSPESWYKAKKTYAMSLAITSLIGYVLGIGDRHMSNVMMNCQTGDLVHIDFGITFDSGKKLAIPERIPFRYTADMRDALGIYGHYGAINRFFEDVYSTLRKNHIVVLLSLMNLKLDPLYKWSLEVSTKKLEAMFDLSDDDLDDRDSSYELQDKIYDENYEDWKHKAKKVAIKPMKNGKTTELFDVVVKPTESLNVKTALLVLRKSKIAYSISEEYSKKCLDTVSDKILGGKDRQSVESCVQRLLNEAQSNDNLGLIFCGWCPFY